MAATGYLCGFGFIGSDTRDYYTLRCTRSLREPFKYTLYSPIGEAAHSKVFTKIPTQFEVKQEFHDFLQERYEGQAISLEFITIGRERNI